jgi:hypothetical protein
MFYTLSQQKEKQKIKWNFCFSLSDEQQLDIVGCKFKVASFTSLFFFPSSVHVVLLYATLKAIRSPALITHVVAARVCRTNNKAIE